ncbi:MAG: amino acid adenylation domain-containing protein, partial [Moritella dasanensis]
PLFKVVTFNLQDGSARLLLIAHHLVVDGVSWRIIGHDLQRAYQGYLSGEFIELGSEHMSMAEWQRSLSHYPKDKLDLARQFWLPMAARSLDGILIPGAQNGTIAESEKIEQIFSTSLTQSLIEMGIIEQRSGCEVAMLTALSTTLCEVFNKDKVMIELEGHGRYPWLEEQDLSESVGWFTTRYPVSFNAESCSLSAVGKSLSQVPDQGLGYGVLRYLQQEFAFEHPQLVFNFLGQVGTNSSEWQLVSNGSGQSRHPSSIRRQLIDVTAQIRDGQLQISWQFPSVLNNKLAGLVKLFEEKLSNLIAPTLNQHYALTPMQQGMFLHSSSSSESLYFNQTVVELNGELDTSAFIQAWLQTVNAEQALKAAFEETSNGEPVQWFAKDAELPVHRYNWLGLYKREQQQRLDDLCIEDRAQGFNLAQPPLMRLHLIHIAEGQYWLIWSRHHLIVDAWCSSLVIKDVLHRYLNLTGKVLSTPQVRPQFEQYISWLARQDMTQSHQFWRDQLADFNTPLVLVKGNQDDGFYLDDYKLSASLTQNIKGMSKREGVTLNAVIQSAWALTLARHSGKHDVVFGMTSSGRPADLEQAQQIIGIFINTLPVRVNLFETMTVPQLLQNTHQQGAELREHEYTSLVDIHAQSELSAGQSLFDTLLVFENEAMSESSEISQHLSVRPLSGYERNSIPLTITIMPHQQLVFRVGCNGGKLSYSASKHMLASLESILTQMVKAESQPLGLLLGASASNEFVGKSQKQWADNWCLEKQILNVAKYSPDAIAICDQDCELTYTQLISRATHLAQALSERGIGVNSSVAICQQRNTELLVSLLAVLWSGAAYIPLDPNQPSARLALILAQAEPDIILVDEQAIELSTGSVQTTLASLLQHCTKDESWLDAQLLPHPEQLAYTIFTSGSTGIPKGVQISRRAFANFLQSMMEITGLNAKDKLLAVTTLGFDIAGLEMFLPLLVGGQVVMASYDASRDGQQLAELIKQQSITVMQATPITWKMLTEQASLNWSNLTVLTGGEALQPSLAQSIVAKGARLFNVYGPTETTVWSSAVALNKHSAAQPHLGSPIANTDFYVLDDWFNPVANGVEGELFIGGEGLARGYTNQPSLTAEVFMPDPFSTIAGARMYQTGDVVCINSQGNMEFIGRKDFQIKLRGYRIEAGEIEAILSATPGVKDVVIQLCYVDTPHACLVGYVTAIQSIHLDIGSLMAQLRDALPSYMVPQSIVVLEAMPLNANNKIDRKALPNPEQSTKVGLPPSSEMELWLASTWGRLLGGVSVFADDDFFALGGNSLLAGQMIALLKQQKNINLNLTLLFRYPVLRDLVAAIMQVDKSELISASSLVLALKQGVNDDGQQQSPLFIFHPAGGHVQAYAELVTSLPPENTVYGIQSPQLIDLSLVPDSVDEFAKLYVKALQSVQPKGPYRLLGWSFGAWLAIAVTNQLEASGQTVEWLGIVDARADAHRAKLNLPEFPIVARYLACLDNETRELLLDKYRLELGSLEADLQQVQTEVRDDIAFEYLSDLLAIHKPLINRDSGASEMHYMQMKLFMKCHLLMQNHRLQPVSVPMAVWWATGTLTDKEYQLGAKENEWQDYGSAFITVLNGDHQSIIRDPLLFTDVMNALIALSS